jgi:hypothetical protein
MPEPIETSSIRADAEASAEDSPAAIAVTAARALALGSALSTPVALAGLDADLAAIGLDRLPRHWGGWKERVETCDASDDVLRGYGLADEVREREEARWTAQGLDDSSPGRSARVDLWRRVAADTNPAECVAWLRAVMTDREPIAAAAAANALSTWRRSAESKVPTVLLSARDVLRAYAVGDASGAQEIARAGLASITNTEVAVPPLREAELKSRPAEKRGSTSTIIHGTRAWAGSWWFVGGDFHTYVLREIRPDLCGRNAFGWDGALRRSHRAIAAERFAGWAQDTVGGTLNTVFAHSYGGSVALHATTYGLKIQDLVLLSTPVENVPVEWRNISRTQSLRIHLDVILLAARRKQFFPYNVDEHHLPQWFWSHSDTHEPNVWKAQDCATTLGL